MQKRNYLPIECLVMFFTLILGLIYPVINICALSIGLYVIFRESHEDVISFLLFAISFDSIFKIQSDGFALINILIAATAFRILYERKFSIPRGTGFPFLIFVLYVIAGGVLNDPKDCIVLLLYVLFGILIVETLSNNSDVQKMIRFAAIGVIASSCSALLLENKINRLKQLLSTSRIKMGAGNYYYRFSGLQANPNYYTVLISVVLAVFVVLFTRRKMTLVDYLCASALTIFGLMSASMSFVVTLMITLLALVLYTVRNRPKALIGILAFSILFVVGLYYFRNTSLVESLFYRLQKYNSDGGVSADSLTTGRSSIWRLYFDYLSNNPRVLLFGAGVGANATKLVGRQAHNFYIEVVFYTGIFGTIIYSILMLKTYSVRRFINRQRKWICLLPFGVLLFRAFARCLFLDDQFVFMLILCFCCALNVDSACDCFESGG